MIWKFCKSKKISSILFHRMEDSATSFQVDFMQISQRSLLNYWTFKDKKCVLMFTNISTSFTNFGKYLI